MKYVFNEKFEKMMEEHQLKNVVILGHMNPDGDAAGSVMGLAHYIHCVYPQYCVFPYLAETMDKGPKELTKTDRIFDPFMIPQVSDYALIVCDSATIKRIVGAEFLEHAAVTMVIDHHAFNQGYGDINIVKISEACAENIYHMADWDRWKRAVEGMGDPALLRPTAADYIYLGIIHDTQTFTRTNEGVFHAALHLLELGVDHSYIMKTMHASTFEDEKRRASLFQMTKREYHGKVAYVILTKEKIQKYGITYEDIHPFSSLLRDCEDIELGFTMYEELPGCWRCSFRSDGIWIDVNELMNPFEGGGHKGAAGLRKFTDDPEKLKDDIIQRVKEMRNDR